MFDASQANQQQQLAAHSSQQAQQQNRLVRPGYANGPLVASQQQPHAYPQQMQQQERAQRSQPRPDEAMLRERYQQGGHPGGQVRRMYAQRTVVCTARCRKTS